MERIKLIDSKHKQSKKQTQRFRKKLVQAVDIREIPINSIKIGARLRRMKDEAVDVLVESIEQIGLLNPIVITDQFKLIAGRHRIEAAKRLGWKTIPAHIRALDSLESELAEIDENLRRNDLTVLERGEHLVRRKAIYEVMHPETKHGAKGGWHNNKTSKLENADSAVSSFVEDTAQKTDLSSRSMFVEIQIANDIAESVKDLIRDTELADKKTELLRLARIDQEKQMQVAEKLLSDEAKSVRDAERLIRREGIARTSFPDGKFRVIYADPPWKYSDELTEDYGGVQYHYPSMTITELCEEPFIEIAADDAVLFLWAPSPMLEECFSVIKAWGFKYKASFVWDKVKHNMGHYNSVRHEFLLVCTRGSCVPDVSDLYDSVQSIERSDKHSEKPEEFRRIIDDLYPYGRRVELFARKQAKGWESYGNQLQR